MAELIGKISKGSKMDQIYIPKNRAGFGAGEYVIISPLKNKAEGKDKETGKTGIYYYGTGKVESAKVKIIEDTFDIIEGKVDSDNIIITGSFLDKGFYFNDLDLIILSRNKTDVELIGKAIRESQGIKAHIINLDSKTLSTGLSIDPLYVMMLSKCVSKKRVIYSKKRKIHYKLLDLNLLKSKDLINNFEVLNGNEKYYLTLNMISILLFIKGKKLNKELVDKEIEKIFQVRAQEIKDNLIKRDFLQRYKKIFDHTFNLILDNIKRNNNEQA